ncbi:MAG: hypothetical protein U1D30_19815 [Planctomycetota bacterium]
MTNNNAEPQRDAKEPQVDRWIRSWEGNQPFERDRVSRLKSRICSTIQNDQEIQSLCRSFQWRRRRRILGGVTGLAAVLLLGVGLTLRDPIASSPARLEDTVSTASSSDIFMRPDASLFAEFTPPASADRLFLEMQREFPGRLNWIAEAGSVVKVGFSDDETASSGVGGDNVVVVRWLVRVRQPGQSDWKHTWRMRVVSRPEEMVSIDLPIGDAKGAATSRVSTWAMPLADGKIAVDALIESRQWIGSDFTANLVLNSGEPKCLAKGESAVGEYELYQLVELIKIPRGEHRSGVSSKEEA